MDPVTAIGFASAIVQFVAFSWELVSGAREVLSSAKGMTVATESLDKKIEYLQVLTRKLRVSVPAQVPGVSLSDEDRLLIGIEKGCEDISREVSKIIDSSKSKRQGSKTQSIRVAYAAFRKKGKMRALEERVAQCRSHILEYLTLTMSDDVSQMSKSLDALTQKQDQLSNVTRDVIKDARSEILAALHNAEIRHAAEAKTLSTEALQVFTAIGKSLEALTKATQAITREDSLLQSLWFGELVQRERNVESPHKQTFRWLLFEQDPDDTESSAEQLDDYQRQVFQQKTQERKERSIKRQDFVRWLQTEDSNVFYFSGKAGAGKSTLMKFLAHEKKTEQELTAWSEAAGKSLILVRVFFWSSGTPLQRNMEGLYRSILWQVLQQCPDLVSAAFPDGLEPRLGSQMPMGHQQFDDDELKDALGRLFCALALSKYRLCLFLDGLDEFEGDHWKFSKAIINWSHTSKDIKFCLSSRPHPEFIQNFGSQNDQHLKLHDLTRHDMRQFVSHEFQQDERYSQMLKDPHQEIDFVEEVVSKADSVFLWVSLVTRDLLKGMGDSCSLAQLGKRLDSVPRGLDGVFQQMLDSIDKPERQRAAQMFLMMTSGGWVPYVSGWAFVQAMLDDIADDPGFTASILSGHPGPYMDQSQCITRCKDGADRAIARSKGLIQISCHRDEKFPRCHHLSFVHLTVFHYFMEPEVRSWLESAAGPQFDPCKSLAHALLAGIKFVGPSVIPDCFSAERELSTSSSSSTSSSVSGFRAPKSIETTVVNLDSIGLIFPFLHSLECADSSGDSLHLQELECLISILEEKTKNHGVTCFLEFFGTFFMRDEIAYATSPMQQNAGTLEELASYCLAAGVAAGLTSTVEAMVSKRPDLLTGRSGKVSVCLWAALGDFKRASRGRHITVANFLMEQAPSSVNANCHEICTVGNTILPPPWTTWTLFLVAFSHYMLPKMPQFKSVPPNLVAVSDLIDSFLRNGAEPSVTFFGYNFPRKPPTDGDVVQQPGGPFYVDLLDMMEFWNIVPREVTQQKLEQARQARVQADQHGWIHKAWARVIGSSREPQRGPDYSSPFQAGHESNTIFVPLQIVPRDQLAGISWDKMQHIVDHITHHGMEHLDFQIYGPHPDYMVLFPTI